jgi:hypothetical protein
MTTSHEFSASYGNRDFCLVCGEHISNHPIGHWDESSAARERLALVARLGIHINPTDWGYHSHKDLWYYCGPDDFKKGLQLRVGSVGEADSSLEQIRKISGCTRAQAMAFIGYPDTPRQIP